jgi:IPT/TIG domain/FG-GAP repeat
MAGLSSPLDAAMDRTGGGLATPWPRAALPWRALVAAALLSLLVGATLSRGLAGEHVSTLRTAVTPRGGPSSLPLAARSPVSAALGARGHAYAVSASPQGLRAVAPAQGLRTRFDRSGVWLSAGAVHVGLSLRAIGYGRSLTVLGAVTPSATDNRVSYAHSGLDEWYANGPLGVEQGFTITRAPSDHVTGALTLSVALSGNARTSLSPDGRSVAFSHGGSALQYTGLTATDATGRTVHSWLGLDAGHVQLRVDTRGARYPLTIDPLIQQGKKLTAAEPEGEVVKGLTGFSVALSADGNTALIGAPRADNYTGVALVFTRSGSTWTQQGPALVGGEQSGGGGEVPCVGEPEEQGEEEGESGCGFGSSVALSADGNTALIGGPRDSENVGAAWVFTRSGSSTWSQQGSKLTGGGELGHAQFGRSVALSADGSTALIGGPLHEPGAAWVFTRAGSSWSQQEELTSGDGVGIGHYFGRSVALSGDGNTALVGDSCDVGCAGAAWVFTRAGSTWSPQRSKLTGGSEESGEGRFGFSVALSADASTALVGARNDNGGAGAAWVFSDVESTWKQPGQKITGGGEAIGQPKFGYGVALSSDGSTALIGARGDTSHRGAAWLFTRSVAGWTQQDKKLTGGEEDEEIGAGNFGASVALSSTGKIALVGGPDDNGKIGAAWAFAPGPTVEGVNPSEGPASGGTVVTITGTSFSPESTAKFDANVATVAFNSATSLTAISPPGEHTVHIRVTTPGEGTSPATLVDRFTYASTGKRGVRPTVASVSPSSGSTAGGTTVTITGTGFEAATAVRFGSVAATHTIRSAGEITAVSPAEPAGAVDVTVATPEATSLTSKRDRFLFLAPEGTPTPTVSPAPSGSSGSSAGASGGVLGFGPFLVSSCTVSLRGKTLAVQSYKRAAVKLSWAGIGTCKGKLKLTVKSKVSHPKRGHKRFTVRTIGTGTFSIAPGAVRTVAVSLNTLGRALMKARHGRLNASIAITKTSPGPVQARTASVRLALQKPHKASKRKK